MNSKLHKKKNHFLLIFLFSIIILTSCSSNQDKNVNTETEMSTVINNPEPKQSPEPVIIDLYLLALETEAALWAAEHPVRDYYRLATDLLGITEEELIYDIPDLSTLKVNDPGNFYITANSITGYETVRARVRYISENSVWWVDGEARADPKDIEAAAIKFEENIFKINRLVFGKEWSPGIDNDERIHFLLIEEKLSPGYYGYFSSNNEYPTILKPFSNQKEMFVLDILNSGINSEAFMANVAHEYQHLIHYQKDQNEDHWLNEAMSQLAYFLSGVQEVGSAIRLTSGEQFAYQPFIQLTSRPEKRMTNEDPKVSLHPGSAHYGAEKLFMVYLLEQYGAQFIKDLVDNPAPSIFSIEEELAKIPDAPSFYEVYANWILANLLNQTRMAEGQFGYTDYNPVTPIRELVNSFRGEIIADKLPPQGSRYYEIQSTEDISVSFSGLPIGPLTPVDPYDGQFVWYSNRGDESTFSLSRSFDLSALSKATLNYNIWYELDDYYDFAYVEISTNGGNTWEILTTEFGKAQNPYEQAYGIGYTGISRDWVSESIDLTSYTGQIVQIRFQVVSDLTANRDGVQIDNIEIPELGFFDGAEDDSGNWETHGFIRSSNYVPVEWIIWLVKVTIGAPTVVERLELDSLQNLDFNIQGFGQDFDFAALVISPTAITTTMEMDYELIFGN